MYEEIEKKEQGAPIYLFPSSADFNAPASTASMNAALTAVLLEDTYSLDGRSGGGCHHVLQFARVLPGLQDGLGRAQYRLGRQCRSPHRGASPASTPPSAIASITM